MTGANNEKLKWVVVNQSYTPVFQQMMESLAADLGPCLAITGTPVPPADGLFNVDRAPAYDRRSISRRVMSWARFCTVAGRRLVGLRGHPFVLGVTNPPMLPHVVSLLGRARGFRYAVLVWDLYPDHLVRTGLLSARSPVVRAWIAANRSAFLGAEVVITLGARMAEAIRAQLGSAGARCRIQLIPNWADTDSLRPIPKHLNSFAVENGQSDVVTVLYSGNIGATHGLLPLVEACEAFRHDARVSFLIVGDGLGRRLVEERVRQRRLTNVRLLDPVPWERLPELLACGDVALVVQAAGTEHLSVPSKTYSAIAAGSAVLALTSAGSDLASLVQEGQLGMVVGQSDVSAIIDAIRLFLDRPELLADARRNARRVAEAHYSAHVVRQRFRDVLAPCVAALQSRDVLKWGS